MTTPVFVTEAGVTVPAITTDQMREVDRVALEETGPNLFQMMENAGRALAQTAIDLLGASWRTGPVVVLAGTGGNGGGGICAARHLANRGADVTLVVTDEAGLGPVPAEQLHVYRGTPGRMEGVSRVAGLEPALAVDALIGYGLTGVARGPAEELIGWMEGISAPKLALDVPSGMDATTGETGGSHVTAAATVTLALPKTGLDAPDVGDLWLADIGIPAEAYRRAGIDVSGMIFGEAFRMRLRPP